MTSSHLQRSHRFGSADDLARKLGEKGIISILEIVCAAYTILYKNQLVKPEMSEDEITEELFKEIVFAWKTSSITETVIPINQKIDKNQARDRGKPPTIDFCFRDRWVKEAFFGFECKLLAEGNNRLYKEYIEWVPIDRLQMLAPLMSWASVAAVITIAFVRIRHTKKRQD